MLGTLRFSDSQSIPIWLIMSKRKVMVGGYDASSDDVQLDLGESPERPSKRLPSGPYAPPRFTATPKPRLGAFQLPGTSGLARASALTGRHTSLPPSRNNSLLPSRHVSSSTSSKYPITVTKRVDSIANASKTQSCTYKHYFLHKIPPHLSCSGGAGFHLRSNPAE